MSRNLGSTSVLPMPRISFNKRNPSNSSAPPPSSSLQQPKHQKQQKQRIPSTSQSPKPPPQNPASSSSSSQQPLDAASIFSGAWLTPTHSSSGSWPQPTSSTSNPQNHSRSSMTPGFQNTGNTCFMNAALQCLLHSPPLVSLLLNARPHGNFRANPSTNSFCAFCSLRSLAKSIHQPTSATKVLTPSSFSRNTRTLSPTFRSGRQEDAHEFIRALLDTMLKSEIHGCPTSNYNTQNRSCASLLREMQGDVHRIFGGALQSSVVCNQCHFASTTSEPFLDLSLEISKIQSIQKALHKFTTSEILSGDNKYKCERCKKLVNAVKKFSVRRAPNVLTLHLKRFDERARKDSRFIEFPQCLDLSKFMQKGSNTKFDQQVHYDLTGLVIHQGSSRQFGHYVACVKNVDGKWLLKDDASTRPVSLQFVMKQRAYVLFYARREATPNSCLNLIQSVNSKNSNGDSPVLKDVTRTNQLNENSSRISNSIKDNRPIPANGSKKSATSNGSVVPLAARGLIPSASTSSLPKKAGQPRNGSNPQAIPSKPSNATAKQKLGGASLHGKNDERVVSKKGTVTNEIPGVKEKLSPIKRKFLKSGELDGRKDLKDTSKEGKEAENAPQEDNDEANVLLELSSESGSEDESKTVIAAPQNKLAPQSGENANPINFENKSKVATTIPIINGKTEGDVRLFSSNANFNGHMNAKTFDTDGKTDGSTPVGDKRNGMEITEENEVRSTGRNETSGVTNAGVIGTKRKVFIAGSGSARKAMARVFGMRENRNNTPTNGINDNGKGERKRPFPGGSVENDETTEDLKPPTKVGTGGETNRGTKPKTQGTSSVFGSEGVDAWGVGGDDRDNSLAGETERGLLMRERVAKRRRANDELDAFYDKGQLRKTKTKVGSNESTSGRSVKNAFDAVASKKMNSARNS